MILDCTLRDGGYYTNWDFAPDLVDTYIKATNNLPIDYLEIGYRSKPMPDYLGEYYYCPTYILQKFHDESTKKIAIMLNEKDTDPNNLGNLLGPCIGLVDMVRIAVNPARLDSCIILAKKVKELGFEVAFNMMYMSEWSIKFPRLFDQLALIEGVVDYLYMVDSYGGVTPAELVSIIDELFQYIPRNIKIGFHGHNNMEMALANTIEARNHSVDIVDSTITGMGRGAGNLKTELLLTYLSKNHYEVNFDALSEVTEGFTELQKSHEWGTQLPYMVSGAYSLPQKDVMSWVTERVYSMNSIIRGLLDDKEEVQPYIFKHAFKNVLIVGGGKSVKENIEVIKRYLKNKTNTAIIFASTKNAALFDDIFMDKYFCLVGNEGLRMEKVFGTSLTDSFPHSCVLPSERSMGTYVPKNLKDISYCIDVDSSIKDSPTSIALTMANFIGALDVKIVGYDGYNNPTERERKLFNENEIVFTHFKEKFNERNFESLFPTKYSLDINSIYSLL